jgi:hypothetical protein
MKIGSINKIIEEFNVHRKPEIVAELLKNKPLTIKFSGVFCKSCAPNEYFEDFRLMLEDGLGKAFYIKKIYEENRNSDNYFCVCFTETGGKNG